MNLTQLRKIARKWQKDLGLTNWKVTVVWGKEQEMTDADGTVASGLNLYDPNHMTSTIKILKPCPHDMEETVIHELLHLFMFPLESAAGFSIKSPTDQWETSMEQTINKLSELLINGSRSKANDCPSIGSDRVSSGDQA